jgi:hypothetical protein
MQATSLPSNGAGAFEDHYQQLSVNWPATTSREDEVLQSCCSACSAAGATGLQHPM